MKTPPVVTRAVARGFSGLAGRSGAQLLPQARLAGPMPWVIAIMVALMTVAACGGLALSNIARGTKAELAGGLTVQIVEAAPQARAAQARAAAAKLARWPGVAAVRPVPEEELNALIAPWLGEVAGDAEAIPVPALIDVRLDGRLTAERIRALRRMLAHVAPAARVDAQANWLQPVFSAIRSLQWLVLALILLLGLATSAAVWLAARTALGSNRETIEVVHHLGGTDSQIARIFQQSVAYDAALGGTAGLALGAAAVFLIAGRFAALESGMVAGGGLGWSDWLLIALIPVAGVVLAMLTARLTVLAALRRML